MLKRIGWQPIRRMRKVAVISVEPNGQERLSFRGKKRTLRKLLSMRLRDFGLEPAIHRPVNDKSDFPKKGKCSGIIIGGSKLDIFDKDLEKYDWMKRLLDFIRQVHGSVPLLGICFGHQAVGRAFGGELKRYGPEVGYEVGYSPVLLMQDALADPLFGRLPQRFNALFSHFSYIANTPAAGTTLAVSANPGNPSIQAFRVGDTTWGVQFHPEYPSEAVRDLLIARRERISVFVDVDRKIGELESAGRHDDLVLEKFVSFMIREAGLRKTSQGSPASRRDAYCTRRSRVPS
jgi:GMP synthase (glutamine-hydrolysing)